MNRRPRRALWGLLVSCALVLGAVAAGCKDEVRVKFRVRAKDSGVASSTVGPARGAPR